VNAAELGRDLREGTEPFLRKRRAVVGLSLVSAGSMGLIALYQMGILKHLPDFGVRGFDSRKVNGSPQAYSYFETPDAALGLASYAATIVLAAAGPHDRARRRPWIPLAMAGKAAIDAAAAGKLTVDQWTKHRAFCAWCLIAAAATFAVLPLAIPEAREAARNV
jgi:uncharacterized membrane protein